MKAIFLTKKSTADTSFETREIPNPTIQPGLVLIKTSAFGLNYADVMARKGLYPEMPPMPCVLGYDVCGRVEEVGEGVSTLKVGDHVVALTRFGGYAEYALADARVCIQVDPTIPAYKQLAMATQLSTAYNAAIYSINLHEGDTVLIHAAAGGVGLGLVQLALYRKCTIIAVAGSQSKLDFLHSLGVHHCINYKEVDIMEELKKKKLYKKIDVIFDSVGGDYVKKGMKALNSGGKYLLYGAAKLSGPKNKLGVAYEALKFGLAFLSPPQFLMPSKGLIGINMLSIADHKPEIVERCMNGVYNMYQEGVFTHIEGKNYPVSELAQAHQALEDGTTVGKMAIVWQ